MAFLEFQTLILFGQKLAKFMELINIVKNIVINKYLE